MPRAGENNIGYLLNQAARQLGRELNARLRDVGLTQGTYALIRSINAAGDKAVTSAEVADDLRMDSSALAHAVDRAVAQGWVVVKRSPDFRRSRVLELTPKAAGALPIIVDAGRWTLEMGLNGFTHDEIAQLHGQLLRIVRNLERAGA